MTATISLSDKGFEISSGQMTISADEIYPWVTSFEKIKPVLKDLPSMKGQIVVSSLKFRGALQQPKSWEYFAGGELRNFALESAFFPGKAEETNGSFRVTDSELSLKGVRTKMTDSLFSVSGTVTEFPADIRKLDLSLQGKIGPRVAAWISALIKLPHDISVRTPFSVSGSTLSWEKNTRTAFDGRLTFRRETQVSLRLTKNPDEFRVHQIWINDSNSDVKANIMLNGKAIDGTFNY